MVNAAGMWAPQVAAMVGAFAPVGAGRPPAHRAARRSPGHELPRDMPCFRDTDNLVYGKAEAGGVLFGGYEPNPVAALGRRRAVGSRRPARCRPTRSGSRRCWRGRSGASRSSTTPAWSRCVCHPDAMTPDGNPLLGPMPGVPGFWIAAGLSLNGFGGAGGIGRTLAEWITDGETELDVHGYRAWRFGARLPRPRARRGAPRARPTATTTGCATRSTPTSGAGPTRLSPLHGRLQELGAVFGAKNGWERADYFEPGQPWRRSGRRPARVRLDAAAVVRPRWPTSTRRSASGSGSST